MWLLAITGFERLSCKGRTDSEQVSEEYPDQRTNVKAGFRKLYHQKLQNLCYLERHYNDIKSKVMGKQKTSAHTQGKMRHAYVRKYKGKHVPDLGHSNSNSDLNLLVKFRLHIWM